MTIDLRDARNWRGPDSVCITPKGIVPYGYGADATYLSREQVEALLSGMVLSTDSQGEYGVYLALEPEAPDETK